MVRSQNTAVDWNLSRTNDFLNRMFGTRQTVWILKNYGFSKLFTPSQSYIALLQEFISMCVDLVDFVVTICGSCVLYHIFTPEKLLYVNVSELFQPSGQILAVR